jgi:tRNA U34 5-methylaminomethyl-2-thiouridine-forming methyltransferase MnmC
LSTDNNDIHLIETSDGSHSLFLPALNETYHSRHGAIQESQWVFIKQGLEYACLNKEPRMHEFGISNTGVTLREGAVPERKQVRIHEAGFGTGLNALLAMRWAEEHRVHVHFTSLETKVLPMEIAEKLNYCETDIIEEAEFERSREQTPSQQNPVPERSRGQRSREQLSSQQSPVPEHGSTALTNHRGQKFHERFLLMHSCPWNEDATITPHFTLHKAQRRVQDEQAESEYDVIFYDAFGPPTQPEMWTLAIFQRMYAALKSGGIFVTYCAKGQVRRDLQAAGFTVERLPGPPGKREMLRATKPAHHE